MKTIHAFNYPIYFGDESYKKLTKLIKKNDYSSIFILVDENTEQHCYPVFLSKIDKKINFHIVKIPSGEIYKNLDTCINVWNDITANNGDRKSLLITLGGGVITDLGGFCASCFKRGIDFVNIPTTLLSMVDASVGGKTGVDLGVLKNQIGLFSNPKMVILDEKYLQTLAEREIKSGTAEILKYGLIYDKSLFEFISLNKTEQIASLLFRSVEIKNEIVLQDPKEKYLRKILNFGHTLGHAIESFHLELEDKETLTHGEAVAIGMVCESYISCKLLDFNKEISNEIKKTILGIYDHKPIAKKDYSNILNLLKHDKKNVNGVVNFVLLKELERCKIDCEVSMDILEESFDFYNA